MRYAVTMNARNEESNIKETIESILNQTIKPKRIVVCNDKSKDRTKEIALSLGVEVVDFPYDHPNWVSMPELARTINLALKQIVDDELDYVLLMGGDIILEPSYVEKITNQMKENVVIGSGVVNGEYSVTPRGAGRVVDFKWWKQYDLRYRVVHGWESWLVLRCLTDGLESVIVRDANMYTTRKTGMNYTQHVWRERGRAFKSLGYTREFVLGRVFMLMIKMRKPKFAMNLWKGYNEKNTYLCDQDIRDYVQNKQKEFLKPSNIKEITKRVFKEIKN